MNCTSGWQLPAVPVFAAPNVERPDQRSSPLINAKRLIDMGTGTKNAPLRGLSFARRRSAETEMTLQRQLLPRGRRDAVEGHMVNQCLMALQLAQLPKRTLW